MGELAEEHWASGLDYDDYNPGDNESVLDEEFDHKQVSPKAIEQAVHFMVLVDEEGKPLPPQEAKVTMTYVQRADIADIQQAFFEGAREGQKYSQANEEMLRRAAEAYVKLVLERNGDHFNWNDGRSITSTKG